MQRLGWRPDIPDQRDKVLQIRKKISLPSEVDWRGKVPVTPAIVDQFKTNSCVGNSSSSMVQFMRGKLNLQPDFRPSRMHIYWFARHVPRIGWENEDGGAAIRDCMKHLVANGVVPEEEWPFDEAKVNERPPQLTLRTALAHRTLQYIRMKRDDDLYHLKHSLAQGFPFMFGITVYQSFEDVGSNGIVPMPKSTEEFLGGHALWAIGYSDKTKRFIVPNSWGTSWGDGGYCYMPYGYFKDENLSDDFWTIRGISG